MPSAGAVARSRPDRRGVFEWFLASWPLGTQREERPRVEVGTTTENVRPIRRKRSSGPWKRRQHVGIEGALSQKRDIAGHRPWPQRPRRDDAGDAAGTRVPRSRPEAAGLSGGGVLTATDRVELESDRSPIALSAHRRPAGGSRSPRGRGRGNPAAGLRADRP